MTDSGQVIITVDGLRKFYGTHEVLRGVDLTVRIGEVVVVIGPSGSGKTTLLRCLNFLEEYQHGHVYIDGQLMGYRDRNGQRKRQSESEIAKLRTEIGMVFQSFNLFPHMTAIQNVMLAPVLVRRLAKAEARERCRFLLEKVGLADLEAVGRSAAARRDRAGAGHATENHALRRGHLRPGSRAGG
jgi:polar amino acid transport system ATP-binding protein